MRRQILQTLGYATYAWLTTSLVFAAALLILVGTKGRIVAVQTNSMRPTFQAGDALLLKRVNPAHLQVGDVITYHNPDNPAETISHRVVALKNHGFIAEGDAQHLPGPVVPTSAALGQAVAIAPYLGTFIDWLHSKVGLLVACYIPAALIVGSELRRFYVQQSRPVYRLPVVR